MGISSKVYSSTTDYINTLRNKDLFSARDIIKYDSSISYESAKSCLELLCLKGAIKKDIIYNDELFYHKNEIFIKFYDKVQFICTKKCEDIKENHINILKELFNNYGNKTKIFPSELFDKFGDKYAKNPSSYQLILDSLCRTDMISKYTPNYASYGIYYILNMDNKMWDVIYDNEFISLKDKTDKKIIINNKPKERIKVMVDYLKNHHDEKINKKIFYDMFEESKTAINRSLNILVNNDYLTFSPKDPDICRTTENILKDFNTDIIENIFEKNNNGGDIMDVQFNNKVIEDTFEDDFIDEEVNVLTDNIKNNTDITNEIGVVKNDIIEENIITTPISSIFKEGERYFDDFENFDKIHEIPSPNKVPIKIHPTTETEQRTVVYNGVEHRFIPVPFDTTNLTNEIVVARLSIMDKITGKEISKNFLEKHYKPTLSGSEYLALWGSLNMDGYDIK